MVEEGTAQKLFFECKNQFYWYGVKFLQNLIQINFTQIYYLDGGPQKNVWYG